MFLLSFTLFNAFTLLCVSVVDVSVVEDPLRKPASSLEWLEISVPLLPSVVILVGFAGHRE